MKKIYVRIEGIYCDHCKNLITGTLLKIEQIKAVKIKGNIAHISYEGEMDEETLVAAITKLGYFTGKEYISGNLNAVRDHKGFLEIVGIFCGILLVAFAIKNIFGFNILNVIPAIDSNITYGMLVITGMLTSIHCISMCGAINLSASANKDRKQNYSRPVLYNLGRVLSYTVTGGIVGFLGSVIHMNDIVSGIVICIAAVVMFLMSLRMLGIIDFTIPKPVRFKRVGSSSFIIGLLNGFMPCGPLQAMQIYALSTESPLKGALSMFLFGIGTVPLMLFMGMVINFVKGKRRIFINKFAAVMILILSGVMLNRGFLALNFDMTKSFDAYDDYLASVMKGDRQIVEFDLSYSGYADIVVQKGIPVEMIIHVDKQYLTGCNNEVTLKDFGITKKLEEGDNIITFTPDEEGSYTYTCWMNMLKNNIEVIDEPKYW